MVADEVAERKINVIKDIPEGINLGYAPDNTMWLCSDKIRKLGWDSKVCIAEGYRRLVEYLTTLGKCLRGDS